MLAADLKGRPVTSEAVDGAEPMAKQARTTVAHAGTRVEATGAHVHLEMDRREVLTARAIESQ